MTTVSPVVHQFDREDELNSFMELGAGELFLQWNHAFALQIGSSLEQKDKLESLVTSRGSGCQPLQQKLCCEI
jgi:hypothetical protein